LASGVYAEDVKMPELEGIDTSINEKRLIKSWGLPADREKRHGEEVWFYVNEGTPHPTDGVVVYFRKGKVGSWKSVDNVYREMGIWGRNIGASR
jgi:hypothetical protein